MDSVTFRRRHLAEYPGEVIGIAVNGTDLVRIIGEIEGPFASVEGEPQIAGSYMGLGLEQLDHGPRKHFLGSFSGPDEKTVLLHCECGEPECWPLMARIETTDDTVTWSDFEQPHRDEWRYDELRFVFNRDQYEAALAEIRR